MKNIPGWDSIGTEGVVKLYDRYGQLVDTGSTDAGGVATFRNLETDTGYVYDVFAVPSDSGRVFGEEFWGRSTPVVITDAETTRSTFIRNLPFASDILVQVKDTGINVRGDSVAFGTHLVISLGVTNRMDPAAPPGTSEAGLL